MDILDFTGTRYIEWADARPSFTGTAASEIGKPGAQALISFGGQRYTVDVDIDGKFTWTAPQDVADGNYSFSVIILDRAGNYSPPALRTFIVDSTPPEVPVLLKLTDNVGDVQGSFDESKPTDDKTPTLTGIAQKGATVFLKDEAGSVIGSAVADKESGVWVLTPVKELEDGVNNLTLSAQEMFAGQTRVSTESPLAITVAPDLDNGGELPPNIITINYAIDNQGDNKGIISNGALTDDATPELRGLVSAGSSVVVYYRLLGSDTWAGSAVATVDGQNWSWTPATSLAGGSYEFQASIGDVSSATFALQIASPEDLLSKTTVEYAIDNVGVNTGLLTNGAWTDDASPELHGRGEANSTVWLYYRNDAGTWSALASVKVGSDGNWLYTPEHLLSGNYEFKAIPTDDSSIETKSMHMKIIAEGSNVPEISYAHDDVGGYIGPVYSGGNTDDKKPQIVGKAEANSIVYIEYQSNNGEWQKGYSAKTDSSGVWRVKDIPQLLDGEWNFRSHSADSNDYSETFKLKIINEVVKVDYIEDFKSFAGASSIASGTILNIGKLSTKSGAEVKTNLGGLGPKSSDPIIIDLNHAAFSFTMTFQDTYGVAQNGYDVEAYDSRGYLVDVEYIRNIGGSRGSYDVYLNSVGPYITRVIIHPPTNGWSKYVLLPAFKYKTDGTPNPEATWLNENAPEDDSAINSTFHMIDVNDDNSGYELTQTQSDSATVNNVEKTQADTLTLLGKDQLIDLTVNNTEFEQVGIIDLTGSGDNALKLDLSALLAHGEQDLLIEDGKTQLVVKGDAGDVVQLKDILPEGSDISEWQHQDGTVTVAGVEYQVYSHGDDAELLIQQGVKTELI